MTFPFHNDKPVVDPLAIRVAQLVLAKQAGNLHAAYVCLQKLMPRETVEVMLRAGFEMSAFTRLPPEVFWRKVQADLSAGFNKKDDTHAEGTSIT